MAISFLHQDLWRELTSSVRKANGKADVAVAYFAQGASKLVPLRAGARLVVDASEGAVKTGQTCPADLLALYRKGVRIYSVPNLHAKVYVVGRKVYVGSANASHSSAHRLLEATVVSSEASLVRAARRFVEELTLQPDLGEEELNRLAKWYRPPHLPGARGRRRSESTRSGMPRFWVARLDAEAPTAALHEALAAGAKEARRQMEHPRRHELDEFWSRRQNEHYAVGDIVMQVVSEPGKPDMVMPPGRVVHVRKWSGAGKRLTFVYIELPLKRRISEPRFLERIGAAKEFAYLRDRRWNKAMAARFMAYWNRA
ncbi:MAG TPA: phospholipase D family protein [Flavobacteriales bacterium]|nr:phospholipase D family protein [Flavobacteriales bacterium]